MNKRSLALLIALTAAGTARAHIREKQPPVVALPDTALQKSPPLSSVPPKKTDVPLEDTWQTIASQDQCVAEAYKTYKKTEKELKDRLADFYFVQKEVLPPLFYWASQNLEPPLFFVTNTLTPHSLQHTITFYSARQPLLRAGWDVGNAEAYQLLRGRVVQLANQLKNDMFLLNTLVLEYSKRAPAEDLPRDATSLQSAQESALSARLIASKQNIYNSPKLSFSPRGDPELTLTATRVDCTESYEGLSNSLVTYSPSRNAISLQASFFLGEISCDQFRTIIKNQEFPQALQTPQNLELLLEGFHLQIPQGELQAIEFGVALPQSEHQED